MVDPMTIAAGVSAVSGLFKRPRKNSALSAAYDVFNQDAGRYGAEEDEWNPELQAADKGAEAAYNQRRADLESSYSPEFRAATLERSLAPARDSYSAARSRLDSVLGARGLAGSSIEAGALANLEGGRARAEGAAGGQLALMDQARRDDASRERLNLSNSWQGRVLARRAAVRAARLQAQRMAAAAGSSLWQQGREDDAAWGQNLGMSAEVLARLFQDARKKPEGLVP